MEPMMHFKSHIQGKNADVLIWPDRIEWSRKGWTGSGAKAAMGMMTLGVSLMATGIRRNEEGETIPISQVSHVAKKRGKGFQTEVVVTTSGGELYMRVGHNEADQVIKTIHAAMRGEYTVQQTQPPAPRPQYQQPMPPPQSYGQPQQSMRPPVQQYPQGQVPPMPAQAPVPTVSVPPQQQTQPEPETNGSNNMDEILAQIKKLAELQEAGILTEEEFSTKKTELLERL